jgi:hypothetical protein
MANIMDSNPCHIPNSIRILLNIKPRQREGKLSAPGNRNLRYPITGATPILYVNISVHYCGYQITNHPINTLNDTSSSPGLETE